MGELCDNRSIPVRMKEIMKERGLTFKILARRANLPADTVLAILEGKKEISANDVPKLAKALEITPNELFGISHPIFKTRAEDRKARDA